MSKSDSPRQRPSKEDLPSGTVSPKARRKSKPTALLDRQSIEAKALGYLDRHDATHARLSRVLTEFVRRRARELALDPSGPLEIVGDLLARYQENGLIDDRRYAVTMARNLVDRGVSRQAIRQKLLGRGVSGNAVEAVVSELLAQGKSELSAARALIKKRKLGKFRGQGDEREYYRRDLAVLARAGFDFETAKRALSVEGAPDEEDF